MTADTPLISVSADGVLTWPGGQCRAALGHGGLVQVKREGDGATPIGRWPMRLVFYRPDRIAAPETRLPLIPIAPDMGWCDDPSDPAYNRLVTLPFAAGHERLWREDHVYDVVVVLGYNDDPPEPGRGSAIFFHLARPDFTPTEGCVAISLANMTAILMCAGPNSFLEVSPAA